MPARGLAAYIGAMSESMLVFDRALVRRHRDRAAAGFAAHAFLYREVAGRLADRLLDIRHGFDRALDLGARGGEMAAALAATGRVGTVFGCDLSPAMAGLQAPGRIFAADEEALPVAGGSLDLVVSNLALHWVNDLPGALIQARRALKPDGLFMAALFGGETLMELRDVLMRAELEATGGAAPRVSPFADLRDLGGLMQRAGFALPVVDSDRLTVTYESPFKLMADLRGMGEANAVLERARRPLRRAVLARAGELYAERHAGPDGRICATFQILYLHGWAPHESQAKPLRPGSARNRLADALGTQELPAGEAAAPAREGGTG